MNASATWVDVLRILVLVAGAANVAVSLVVTWVYWRVYRAFHNRNHRRVPRWRGLLPRHVVVVGLAYSLLVIGTMGEMVLQIRSGFTSRIPVYGVAYVLGFWSMWDVLGHSRHRLHNLRRPDVPHDGILE